MRGYFGIGVENISKAMNVGALWRTAHAFGASFVFTAGGVYDRREVRLSDTSNAKNHIPLFEYPDIKSACLPNGCALVGVELTDDAVDLPTFHHPQKAAYILGPERGSLSPEITQNCDHIVKIPTKFCINVSLAGALVMYDRLISNGKFPNRPLIPGGKVEELPPAVFGQPLLRHTRR